MIAEAETKVEFADLPREMWEEYERRKRLIANIGLECWEYEIEVHRIAVELGIEEA